MSCGKDKTIKLWDPKLNASIMTITNDTWIYNISYLRFYNSNYIAAGDDQKNIKLWNMQNGSQVSVITSAHKNGVGRLLYVENKEPFNMLLSSSNPDIKLWNLDNSSCVRTFAEHSDWVNALVLLKDNNFCSGSGDKSIKIWSINSSISLKTISVHKSYVACLTYLKDYTSEDVILTGSLGKTSKLVDIYTGKAINSYARTEGVFKMEILPGEAGNTMIAGCYWGSKNIKVWGKTN